MKRILTAIAMLTILAALLISGTFSAMAEDTVPTLTTGKPDYSPGEVVDIHGVGFTPGVTYAIPVLRPDGRIVIYNPITHDAVYGWEKATADELGDFLYYYQLNGVEGTYEARAYPENWAGDWNQTPIASVTFTDGPPSIQNLWQCDPPSVFDPSTYTCVSSSATGWVTGNDDGPFYEGDTVPYRTRFQNLVLSNQYSITIEWDTTKGSKHAIDYLKTFNATITAADPCLSLTGLPAGLCSGIPSTFAIPVDTFMQSQSDWIANAGVQDPGEFTMYGGTITGVSSSYTTPPNYTGDTSTSITIFFTANSTDVVLAWGGHIAERDDWGLNNSAVSIPGSPYHMRILSWHDVTKNSTLNVGNTDRSLSAEAVIYPASITIIKQANPEGVTSFPFTASPAPLVPFALIDDGSTANTKVFSNIINFTTYTVAETVPLGWRLDSISCSVTSPNSGTQIVSLPSVSIAIKEGENVTCTFNDTRIGSDLTVSKTAIPSFTRTYAWTIDKSVDDTLIEIAEGGNATFNYKVSVSHDNGTDSNHAVSGVITVTNPNSFEVAGVTVTDSLDTGACVVTGGTNVSVPANSSVNLNYSCAAANPGAILNTATATWNKAAYNTPNGSAFGTASVAFATPTTIVNGTITVKDDKTNPASPVTLGTATYTQSNPIDFTYALTKPGVPGTCTDYTNTAVIDETKQSDTQKVTVCVGKDLTVSKTANADLDRLYKWLIDKSVNDTLIEIAQGGTATFNYSVKVSPNGYTDSGWTLGGTITIVNPNDWEDVTVGVTDTLDKGGTCSITEAAPYIVPKGGSLVLHYTCTTDGTTTKNTVDVTWNKATYFTPNGSASNFANVSFAIDNETNKVITVIDDKTDPANPVTLGTRNWFDGEHTFTYSLSKPGVPGTCTDYTNTAVIDETKQSDTQKVTVCVGKDLTTIKTATPTFTRTWDWSIVKDYDAIYHLFAGESKEHSYLIKVNPTPVDSLWKVTGKITVYNPNDWEAIVANVSDAVNNGGSCVVTGGTNVTVPKASGGVPGKVELNYTCTWTEAPTSKTGINTATVTWDKDVFFTPSGSASNTAGFTFDTGSAGNPTEVNPVINITDDKLVGEDWSADRKYAEFSYKKTFDCSEAVYTNGIYTYTWVNTAAITQTGASDKATVVVNCYAPVVTKTAIPHFTREWSWDIEKSAEIPYGSTVRLAPGATIDVDYLLTVTASFVEYDFKVKGVITIVNPNPEAAMVVKLEDYSAATKAVISKSDTCDFNKDTEMLTIAEDGLAECGYSIDFGYDQDSKPKTEQTNTAYATLNKLLFEGEARYTFGDPTTELFETASVSDLLKIVKKDAILGDKLLKELSQNFGNVTASPGNKVFTFTYTLTFGEYTECGDYEISNLAKVVSTDAEKPGVTKSDEDDWKFILNVPCPGCGFTQGYWKTHADEKNFKKYDTGWDVEIVFEYEGEILFSKSKGSDAPWLNPAFTWLDVLSNNSAGGNAYYILARQWIAAMLNTFKPHNPAYHPELDSYLGAGWVLLDQYKGQMAIPEDPDRSTALGIAEWLDDFNNGELAGGPIHCP